MKRRSFLALVGASTLAGCSGATGDSEPGTATSTPTRRAPTPTEAPTATESPSPTESATPTPVPRVRYRIEYDDPWTVVAQAQRTDGLLDTTHSRSRPMISHLGRQGLIEWVRIRATKQTESGRELTLVLDVNGEPIVTDVAGAGESTAVIYHSFGEEPAPTFTPTATPTPAPPEFTLGSLTYYETVRVDEPFTLSFRIDNIGDGAGELQTTLQYDYEREVGTRWHDVQSFDATIPAGESAAFETDEIVLDSEGDYHFRLTNVDMDPFTIRAVQ